MSLKIPRSTPTNGEHETAIIAVSQARLARAEKPRSATREGTKHAQFNARGPARSKSGWGSKNERVPEGSPAGSTLPAADDETFHYSTRPVVDLVVAWSLGERSRRRQRGECSPLDSPPARLRSCFPTRFLSGRVPSH